MGAGRAPNTQRQSYVIKRCVGKKIVSTYVGAVEGAGDITFIDSIFRQAALLRRNIASELILALKLMHAENEQGFATAEAKMTAALNAAGCQ
jgi:hypothetical protein